MKRTITLGIILVFICITSCNKRTKASGLKISELNGVLCYPSEYIPQMTIYLKDINSDEIHKLKTEENQRQFKFTASPQGEYYLYAYTIEKTSVDSKGSVSRAKGGYTKAVPCGLNVKCNDHTLLLIKLKDKVFKDTISLCDWYGAIVPEE